MAAVTDLANHAAAVTAGYQRVQTDRGAPPTGVQFNAMQPARYTSKYELPVTGASVSNAGNLFTAYGESSVSQAAADTAALNALNANRRARYGGSGGRASGDADSPNSKGGTHTVDKS